jgi:hypothetical protein
MRSVRHRGVFDNPAVMQAYPSQRALGDVWRMCNNDYRAAVLV